VFVDTNVLVYAHVAEAPWHQEAQDAIVGHEAAGAPLWVSRQVLREYLVSLTRPQQFPIPPSLETVVAQVRQFPRRFRVADEGPEVTTRLLALLLEVPTHGRRIHDANIVATMLVYGGYVRDTCKKVSQGCEPRLGADTLDDLAHHRTADAAR
jgi:predicted nucleic acid-binding protein